MFLLKSSNDAMRLLQVKTLTQYRQRRQLRLVQLQQQQRHQRESQAVGLSSHSVPDHLPVPQHLSRRSSSPRQPALPTCHFPPVSFICKSTNHITVWFMFILHCRDILNPALITCLYIPSHMLCSRLKRLSSATNIDLTASGQFNETT